MRLLLTTVLIVASLLALAGCKSDSKEAKPLSDEEFLFAATAAANAVLLTDADLPSVFVLDPDDDDDDEELPDPEFDLTGECEEFEQYIDFESEDSWRNAAAEAEGLEYKRAGGGMSVSSDAAAFREPDKAAEEVEMLDRFITTCDEQMERIFNDYFAELGALEEDGVTVENFTADFSTFDVPERGDWSGGNRMQMKFSSRGLDFEVIFDTILVRVGRMVGSVDMTHSGTPDQELYDEMVDLVVSRLEEQDAKLPQ